jgi:dUTPase
MFKILEPHCEPKRGTKYSAYVDLFSREDVVIGAGETKVIKLGVKLDTGELKENWKQKSGLIFKPDDAKQSLIAFGFNTFLKSHYLEVALRSSLAVKGLIIANGIGIIDLDYPDEIGLIVHNPVKVVDISLKDYAPSYRVDGRSFHINKGYKVCQCTLKEHKGFLIGYESDVVREGGFGSTGK